MYYLIIYCWLKALGFCVSVLHFYSYVILDFFSIGNLNHSIYLITWLSSLYSFIFYVLVFFSTYLLLLNTLFSLEEEGLV